MRENGRQGENITGKHDSNSNSEKQKGTSKIQCHLDKNDEENRVYRDMYPVLFYVIFQKVLT